MENAIKAINEAISGIKDLETLSNMENSLNKALEARKAYLTMVNEGKVLSEKNFGFIKEAFEEISPKLYNSNEGKGIIKNYINEIKSNKSLNSLYHIYENIYHSVDNADADYFVNHAFDNTIDKKELNEGVNKVGRILAEGYFLVNGNIDFSGIKTDEKLNESIEYLATSKKSLKSLSKRSACVKDVKNYLNENAGKNIRNSANISNLDEMVESYNKKYSMDENFDTIKNIINSKDKKGLFEEYKASCLDSIKKVIEENSTDVNIDRLQGLYEAVEKKTFVEENINKDIANLIDLKSKIEEVQC